jgi:hypothetical protein
LDAETLPVAANIPWMSNKLILLTCAHHFEEALPVIPMQLDLRVDAWTNVHPAA